MKRWAAISGCMLTVAVAAYMAVAQQPRSADGGPDDRLPRRERSAPDDRTDRDDGPRAKAPRSRGPAKAVHAKTGVVTEITKNPDGEIDGLVLDDGTEVRFRPGGSAKIQAALAVKDRVTIEGWTHTGETGIHAATIKIESSGQTLTVDRPPPEIADGDERGRPNDRDDAGDDRRPMRRGEGDDRQSPPRDDANNRRRPPPRDDADDQDRPRPKPEEDEERPRRERGRASVAGRPANPAPADLKPAPSQHAEPASMPGFMVIPAGSFDMGDHFGFVDPKHGSDEVPIHTVRLDSFWIGIHDITTQQYCRFLNAALEQKTLEVRQGGVYLRGGRDLLCDTRQSSPSSQVGWDGQKFSVLDNAGNHPMVCVRWHGAAACCNWLSEQRGYPTCYNPTTWECDFNKSGFRLPTEAEWEYAARGGLQNPYYNFSWGSDADSTKANVPESHNPFRSGPKPAQPPAGYKAAKGPPGQAWRMGAHPLTTPVGFFNGQLQHKSDFNWPGDAETFQTANGANGFGLYDMTGNVWQWCTELYERNYYAYSSAENPPGPAQGSPMPDGKVYRCMRGGSWFNGEFGHSRVSNRDPSYFRGPDPVTGLSDADGPWFHIGFRMVRPLDAEKRPALEPTPVPATYAKEPGAGPDGPGGPGGGRRGGPGQRRRDEGGDRGGATADREGPRGPDPYHPAGAGRSNSFRLQSSAIGEDGILPKEFTGDGDGVNPPLQWSGAPAGVRSYALIMHHTDARAKNISYWILHDIPTDVRGLPRDAQRIGTPGISSRSERAGYVPPHSAGPGTRTYVFTVYALSTARLSLAAADATQEALLEAMQGKILATADLSVSYTRYTVDDNQQEPAAKRERPPPGDDQEGGRRRPKPEDGGGPRPGGRVMEENKTPQSPHPGQTVGLFLDTPQACPGYTLFAPKHNTVTYLMNNQGQVVHQWKSECFPGQAVYLKPNGHLLHPCMTRSRSFTGGGEGGRIEEYDWDGKLLWEFPYSTSKYQQHHDITPLPNGNILMLVVQKKSYEECVAAGFGFDARMLRDRELYPDSVVEVQPVYPNGGKVVWQWRVWDHLIQDYDQNTPNYGDVAAHPERIYVNCNGRGAPAFWNHMNSIAYNAKLDQIVLSVRGCNEIWVVDHSTTMAQAAGHTGGQHGKGGDLIYRWGNPAAYKRGTLRDKQLVQQHDAEWIPDGYPGAGHLTIFNNGYDRGWTSIEEIVPPLDAAGHYILEPGQPYGPEKPVWHYEAPNRTDFFSSEISGAHRLPNGNTLICAGVIGHLFEVTADGRTVWQYVNPMVRGGILAQGELPGKDVRGHLFNAVFKVHRYPADYPGLKGRDLAPRGPIELPASQKGQTGMDRANASPNERPPEDRAGGSGEGDDRRPPRDDDRRPPRDERN